MVPILAGEVRIGEGPMTNGTVVLHQVSAEASGEIDSVTVADDGSFQFRLPYVPDHETRSEIFFASVEYRGLLYFGQAVTEAIHLDSLYVIQAYDTASVPPGGADLPLTARNLFLEPGTEGWIATDVLQVYNEGDRTLFSPVDGPVWTYPLPPEGADFQLGQGDLAPDAVQFLDGRLEVSAPLPPGERYIMVRYLLPNSDFSVPMPGRTDRMELMMREPAPAAEFPPLTLVDPVEIETGNVFRRYAADSVFDAEVRAEMAPQPWALPAEWLGLLVASVLGAAGVIGYRLNRRPKTQPVVEESPSRDEVLVSIAQLDDEFQDLEDPSTEQESAYRKRRGALLAALKRRD